MTTDPLLQVGLKIGGSWIRLAVILRTCESGNSRREPQNQKSSFQIFVTDATKQRFLIFDREECAKHKINSILSISRPDANQIAQHKINHPLLIKNDEQIRPLVAGRYRGCDGRYRIRTRLHRRLPPDDLLGPRRRREEEDFHRRRGRHDGIAGARSPRIPRRSRDHIHLGRIEEGRRRTEEADQRGRLRHPV